MLPLELPPLLTVSGFGLPTRQNLSYLDTTLDAGSAACCLPKVIGHFAISEGIPEEDAKLLLSQCDNAVNEGRFGFVHFQY